MRGLTERSSWFLGLVSLWLIAMYGLLFFLASRRSSQESPRRKAVPTEGDGLAEPARVVDTLGLKLDAFCSDYSLTPREREVLTEAIHGFSMEAIGRKLCISKDTVKTHLQRAYRKAGVNGKQELIAVIDAYPQPLSQ